MSLLTESAELLRPTELAFAGTWTVVAVVGAVAVAAVATPILVGEEPRLRILLVRLAVVAMLILAVGLTRKAFWYHEKVFDTPLTPSVSQFDQISI
ncbi:hypothetical protein HDU79_011530 [Rhizoclosmatium sp. JEL0117]|nr:hypothetical protein HDU79_011530 [Rhizoclosmatium sp. JEL0117]